MPTRALVWESEALIDRFNDSAIMALSGTRLSYFRRSRLQIQTQNALLVAHSRLARILLSFTDPTRPNPVDWLLVDDMLSDVQTLVLKDLRVFGPPRLEIAHKREKVPWPNDFVKRPVPVKLPGREG